MEYSKMLTLNKCISSFKGIWQVFDTHRMLNEYALNCASNKIISFFLIPMISFNILKKNVLPILLH